jgi:hypothetical protein
MPRVKKLFEDLETMSLFHLGFSLRAHVLGPSHDFLQELQLIMIVNIMYSSTPNCILEGIAR